MGFNSGQGHQLDSYLTGLIHGEKGIELERKWINPDPKLKGKVEELFPESCQNHHIFDPSEKERPKTCVTIRSIKGTKYENIRAHTPLAIYAGGPGSMIGAALDSAFSYSTTPFSCETSKPSRVMYVTYDFKYSNARSSAYYFHIRHSNALDADSLVRGPNILYEFFRRQFMSARKLELEARKLSYLKVDLSLRGILSSPSHCLTTLSILVQGLYHTYRNVLINSVSPCRTDWAHNRCYSKFSVPVLRFLESFGEKLGINSDTPNSKPALLVGTENDAASPKAIHVVFDKEGAKHVESENVALSKISQIVSRELSPTDIVDTMGGENHDVYKAYVYPGDGRIKADMNLTLAKILNKTNNTWKEGVAVESIYIDENGVRGVVLQDVKTKKTWYQPCSSVVLSLGYSAKYEFEQPRQVSHSISASARNIFSFVKWKIGLSHPVPNTTVATGCSGYFLVKGKIPIIGAQNSHWTEVAYSSEEDLTLAKLTGGGNIGSESIPATYALNNLEHLKALFKDRLVDVLSIDSCSRAINPENDIQFYRLAPGLVVSLGLGGTGMTKSGANGALSYLLSHPSVSSSDLIPGHPDLFASVETHRLVNEYTSYTLRALNLENSFSAAEVISATVLGVGAYYIAKKLSRLVTRHPTILRSPGHSVQTSSQCLSSGATQARSLHSLTSNIHPQTSCNLRLLSFVKKSLRRVRL